MKNLNRILFRSFALLTLTAFAGCSDDTQPKPKEASVDKSRPHELGADVGPTDGNLIEGLATDTSKTDAKKTDAKKSDAKPKADAKPKDTVGTDAISPYKVVITEFIPNPSVVSDSNGEWFEIYNASSAPIDLQNWKIIDDGSDSHTIASSVIVAAGAYAVLGRSNSTSVNGGVTVAYAYGTSSSSYALANTADEIILLDNNGLFVDRVDYTSSWTIPNGASLQLKAPSLDNNVYANWCVSTVAWGTVPAEGGTKSSDKGTPGAANVCLSPDGGTVDAAADAAADVAPIQ